MTTFHTVSFQKTVLASLIGLCLSQSVFALENLEPLDDSALADTTGEGIAMLPENFRMVFQGANDNTTQQLTDYTNRAKDTGYIRYIPVGPLTAEATASGAQKADMFLYGLAISRADSNINNRYNSSSTGQIKSWGSADNPWLLKVQSATIPDFAGVDRSLSYLSFEAPTYDIAGFSDVNKDDYHLKLGLWADIFMRNPTVAAPDNDPAGWGAGLSNRLRLQAIWDDFSINGSSINLFQTLGGATNAGGLSASYNNTLGLAGTLRLNSGDTSAATGTYKATVTGSAPTRTRTNQEIYLYSPTNTSRVNSNWEDKSCQDVLLCYQYRVLRTTDTYTNAAFDMPSNLSVLRFSTKGVTGENTSTPAIDSSTAPTFDDTEGLFMYGANFNLVLGSLYQPLVIGVADDGKNLNMEITRIPNQANVYRKIYTPYAGFLGGETAADYKGSTCNVYQCGTATNPATHSSITIGTTNYSGSSTNLVSAYSGSGALGVSFGALQSSSISSLNKDYYQLQYKYRRKDTWALSHVWSYLKNDDSFEDGALGTLSNWNEFERADWIDTRSVQYTKFSIDPRVNHTAYKVEGRTNASDFCTGAVSPQNNCSAGLPWGGTTAYPLPNVTMSSGSWVSNPAPATATPANELSAINNLGSAVIDGLLIQHVKLTTKGL